MIIKEVKQSGKVHQILSSAYYGKHQEICFKNRDGGKSNLQLLLISLTKHALSKTKRPDIRCKH